MFCTKCLCCARYLPSTGYTWNFDEKEETKINNDADAIDSLMKLNKRMKRRKILDNRKAGERNEAEEASSLSITWTRFFDIRDTLQSAIIIVGKDVAKPGLSVALLLLMLAIMARAHTTAIPVVTVLLETPEAG